MSGDKNARRWAGWGGVALVAVALTGGVCRGAVYTAVTNGNWQQIATWGSTNYPQASDDAVVTSATALVTVTGNLQCATLDLGTAGQVNVTGTSARLAVLTSLASSGGDLGYGSGGTRGILTNLGTFTRGGAATTTVDLVFVNAGTVAHQGSGGLQVQGPFLNASGAAYRLQSDAGIGGGATFTNRGLLVKEGGTGASTITAPYQGLPGSTLEVQTASLTLAGPILLSNCWIQAAAGATAQVFASGSTNRGLIRGEGAGTVLWNGGNPATGFSFGVEFTNGLHWAAGTLNGALTNRGLLLVDDGGGAQIGEGTLINTGTLRRAGSTPLALVANANTSVLFNTAGGLIDIAGDGLAITGLNAGAANAVIVSNRGVIRKSSGTGVATLRLDSVGSARSEFNNAGGVIEVQQGTLVLDMRGAQSTGIWNVATGAALDISGGRNLALRGIFSGTGDGQILWNGGAISSLTPFATFAFPQGVTWRSGTLAVGNLTNAGLLILEAPGASRLGAATLVNSGTVRCAASGWLDLSASNNVCLFQNQEGALFDIQSDGLVVTGSNHGANLAAFVNRGVVRKSAGGGTSVIAMDVADRVQFSLTNGVIQVQTGSLVIAANGLHATGTLDVATGAALDMMGGVGASFRGWFTGTGGGDLLWRGALTSAALPYAAFTFTNGLRWREGWLIGTMTNGGLLALEATNQVQVFNGTLFNAGVVRDDGDGSVFLTASDYGTVAVSNLAGALYEIGGDGLILTGIVNTGSVIFDNAGTLRKTAGAGVAEIRLIKHLNSQRPRFVNRGGAVEVQAGALLIDATYLDATGLVRLTGGDLTLAGYHTTNGTLAGTGTLTLISGSMTNSGTVAPGLPIGTLALAGAYTQTASGVLACDVGGVTPGTQHDQFAVSGTANLGGALNVTLTNGFIPVAAERVRLLTAASRLGTFAATNLPALSGGLWWVVVYGTNYVELRVASPSDTDGDGLPDAWESTYFRSLDASEGGADDFDGDGLTDVAEQTGGTDPANPDSGPALAAITGAVAYAGAATGPVRVAVAGPLTNRALSLAGGADDYVRLAADTWFGTNFTVEAWIYIRQVKNAARLIDFGNFNLPAGVSDNIIVALDTGNNLGKMKVTVYTNIFNWDSEIISPDSAPLNRWFHFAVVRDGTNGVAYLDGVPWFTGQLHAPLNVVRTNNWVGRSSFVGDDTADAMIDELRIWRTAVPASQLVARMRTRLTGLEPGLAGYYPFDQAAHDLGTNRLHGALSGTAATVPVDREPDKRTALLAAPGAFAISNLPVSRAYAVTAFRDRNGNGAWEPDEPWGAYTNGSVLLTDTGAAVSLTLGDDRDSDADGLPDRVERGYGAYELIAFTGSWAEARADATNRGGRLATIAGVDEWLDIRRQLGTNLVGRDIWIGATDERVEGDFAWVSGETWGYARWAGDQPDNVGGADDVQLSATTSVAVAWTDEGDFVTNRWYLLETGWYSNPENTDTDGDGLPDGVEALTYGSSPVLDDSDGDILEDGEEVARWGTQPALADTDHDGQDDGFEIARTTSPTNAATFSVIVGGSVTYTGSVSGLVRVAVTADGYSNRVLQLDGTDDGGVVPDAADLNLVTGATVECWVRAATNQPETGFVMAEKSGGYIDYTGWRLEGVTAAGAPAWICGESNVFFRVDATTNILDNTWHHVAGTYDGRTLALYVDGRLQGTTLFTNGLAPSARAVQLGRSWGLGTPVNHLRGQLDEVRLWDRALTPGEILYHLRRPAGGAETGLVACWRFDDRDLRDYGAHGHDGVFTNGAASVPGMVETLQAFTLTIPTLGPYAITNIPQPESYVVFAFADQNSNGVQDVEDIAGIHVPLPLAVTGAMAGVEIPLGDADSDHDGLTDLFEATITHSNPFSPDSDGDTMPDGWEFLYGLNLTSAADATLDQDSDRFRNAEEYAADTNPTNAASLLRILTVRAGPTALVTFASSTNRQYSLEALTNILNDAWTPVPPWTNVIGAGGTQSMTEASGGRIQILRLKVGVP